MDAATALTAAISAIALWFAARAATAAEKTVRLTRDMQIGADLHRLLDELWRVKEAAHHVTMMPTASEGQRVFRNCQSLLAGSVSADLPFPDDVRETLDWLVRVDPTVDPERIVVEAQDLWTRLARQRLADRPPPSPPWPAYGGLFGH